MILFYPLQCILILICENVTTWCPMLDLQQNHLRITVLNGQRPWGHSTGSFSIVIAWVMTVVSPTPPPRHPTWPYGQHLWADFAFRLAGFSVCAKLHGVVEVMCNICGGWYNLIFSESYCFDMRPWLDFPLYFSWGETDCITLQAK